MKSSDMSKFCYHPKNYTYSDPPGMIRNAETGVKRTLKEMGVNITCNAIRVQRPKTHAECKSQPTVLLASLLVENA